MEHSGDQEASVVVEQVLYPSMTQGDLDEAIERRYAECDETISFLQQTKMSVTTPEDEGYSSPTSPSYSQSASPVSESRESPDWNMDQTVPEEILDLFPSLVDLCDIRESDAMLNEFLFGSSDVCQPEQPYESVETPTEVSLPEFDVLLKDDYEEVSKCVTREVHEPQVVAPLIEITGKTQKEDVDDESYEEESGCNDDDEDDDDDDEDYIPPGRSKHQRRKASNRRSHHEYDAKIYSQLPSEKRSRRHSPQLWVFLLNCLCDTRLNPSVIVWEDKAKGIFKLKNSRRIAELWGKRLEKVQKKAMDYEKFSRAIRYYYQKGVILSHPKRLTYQFGPKANGWQQKLCGVAV